MAKKSDKKALTGSEKSQIGLRAGLMARQRVEEACAKVGLTVEKVAQTVVEALNAHVVKAQLNPKGEWAVSKPFIDHPTRLKAVEKAEDLLDLKPTERHQVNVTDTMTDDEINDRLKVLMGSGKK